VDLVGYVGADAEAHRVALLEAQLRDLARGDERGLGLLRGGRLGRRRRLGARRRGLFVVAAGLAEEYRRDDRDRDGDRQEREPLRARHGGGS
jgi:hypothetical protein